MDGFDDNGFGSGTAAAPLVAPDPIGDLLSRLRKELESAVDEPAWPLTDEQVRVRFREALALRASVDELTARLLRSISDRELPEREGASSPRAWLMCAHGVSTGEAMRLIARAGAHPGDPDGVTRDGRSEPTRLAWADGKLSAERAVVVADAIGKLDPSLPTSVTGPVQADLIGQSAGLVFDDFRRLCSRTVEIVDPDTADALLEQQLKDQEARAEQATSLSFRRVGDGTTRFSGRLPDLSADIFKAALDGYTNPRRKTRPVEATAAPLDNHTPVDNADDERPRPSYRQRLGHALAALLEHLPVDKLPHHGASSPTVVVTMTLDQLLGGSGEARADTGTVISPAQARRLACNSEIIPAVLDGDSKVLDLGMARRLFDRYQRIALALRDRGCVFPGCDRTPRWCEAHHILEWSRNGPTDISNGCLLCCFHHHLIHKGEWHVVMGADGKPEIIPPARIDAGQEPIRHSRLKPKRC